MAFMVAKIIIKNKYARYYKSNLFVNNNRLRVVIKTVIVVCKKTSVFVKSN